MTAEPDIEYDRSVVGVDADVGSVEITREVIANFCTALGESNPLYTDEEAAARGPHGSLTAPPAILISLGFQQGADPKVQFGNATFVGGHHLDVHEPIRLGDTISAKARIKEVFPKTGRTGTMVFVVRQVQYTNQHGRPVATAEMSMVHREV